ncbi:hypothetical protein FHG87_004751 [Trinorchestia longiramus]|nr:hypothetical protein FHG87_004751 [Trinorchestia longiramus]
MECELIAINVAFQWILLNNCPEEKLGHVAVNCNSPLHCLVCSGPHTKDECTAKPGQEKCANYHQTNIASSKAKVLNEGQVDPTYGQMEKLSNQQPSATYSTAVVQDLNDLPSTSQHFRPSGIQETTCSNNITQPAKKPSPQMWGKFLPYLTSEVRTGPDLEGDHFPVCCILGVVPVRLPMEAAQHWKLGAADWTKWTSHSNVHTDQTHVGSCNAIMSKDFLLSAINSAAEKLVPMSTGRTGISRATLWWNAACSRAEAQCRRAKEQLSLPFTRKPNKIQVP